MQCKNNMFYFEDTLDAEVKLILIRIYFLLLKDTPDAEVKLIPVRIYFLLLKDTPDTEVKLISIRIYFLLLKMLLYFLKFYQFIIALYFAMLLFF
jgi:hypothetical protein